MKRRNILLGLLLVSTLTACNIVIYRDPSEPSEASVESQTSSETTTPVESVESQDTTPSTPSQTESTESHESTTPSQTETTTETETQSEESTSVETSESQEESQSEIPPQPVYPKYTLDKDAVFESKDEGNFYQTNVSEHLFDVIGYEALDNGLVSIKQKAYGPYTYLGMIYNRSIIDGLKSITVNFDNTKDLYIVFSEYLMEDMTFPTTSKIESGVKIDAGENKGYFVLYTNSTEKVDITSISIEYDDEKSFADSMLYTPATVGNGYARSVPSSRSFSYDLIDITNNPTETTNNYSQGKHPTSGRDNFWYRWNGIALAPSEYLGKEFSIHMTIIGNISQMIDPDNLFCYSIWPEFEREGIDANNYGWELIMIGNDDYEPMGKAENRINTKYDGFTGRFITEYSGAYDPDETKTTDGSMTFREAFEAYTLPFWNVEFKINGVDAEVIVNGISIFSKEEDIFDYDEYDNQSLRLHRLDIMLVNYGQGHDGANPYDPRPSYSGTFTMPRLEKVNNA